MKQTYIKIKNNLFGSQQIKSRLNSVLFRNVTHSNTVEFKYNPQFYAWYQIQT